MKKSALIKTKHLFSKALKSCAVIMAITTLSVTSSHAILGLGGPSTSDYLDRLKTQSDMSVVYKKMLEDKKALVAVEKKLRQLEEGLAAEMKKTKSDKIPPEFQKEYDHVIKTIKRLPESIKKFRQTQDAKLIKLKTKYKFSLDQKKGSENLAKTLDNASNYLTAAEGATGVLGMLTSAVKATNDYLGIFAKDSDAASRNLIDKVAKKKIESKELKEAIDKLQKQRKTGADLLEKKMKDYQKRAGELKKEIEAHNNKENSVFTQLEKDIKAAKKEKTALITKVENALKELKNLVKTAKCKTIKSIDSLSTSNIEVCKLAILTTIRPKIKGVEACRLKKDSTSFEIARCTIAYRTDKKRGARNAEEKEKIAVEKAKIKAEKEAAKKAKKNKGTENTTKKIPVRKDKKGVDAVPAA